MVRIKSSQKYFTEEEVTSLTGICREHLRGVAQSKHLGTVARSAPATGPAAEKWLFTNADLMIITVVHPRCQH